MEHLMDIDFDKYKKKKPQKNERPTNCESCVHYDYDEDVDAYVCGMDLDEDEVYRIATSRSGQCPYYRQGDDYTLARKQ